MSPEQIRRGRVDGRRTCLRLGSLSEMLTGGIPCGPGFAATLASIRESELMIPNPGRLWDNTGLAD
jgi:hypothetical protein